MKDSGLRSRPRSAVPSPSPEELPDYPVPRTRERGSPRRQSCLKRCCAGDEGLWPSEPPSKEGFKWRRAPIHEGHGRLTDEQSQRARRPSLETQQKISAWHPLAAADADILAVTTVHTHATVTTRKPTE